MSQFSPLSFRNLILRICAIVEVGDTNQGID